jgi:hypothetical protein
MCVFRATEMTHNGGSIEPDMKALAVMQCTWPSCAVDTTVTPVANLPMTERKSA